MAATYVGQPRLTPRTSSQKAGRRLRRGCANATAAAWLIGIAACSGTNDALQCPTGALRCACFPNSTCDTGLSCVSSICVALDGDGGLSGIGASSSSSTNGGSGNSSAGSSSGGNGNSSSGGSASSSSGSSGASSSSSSSSGNTCGGAPATVIDNFTTCDTQICNLGGRSGSWFQFASVNINQAFAVSEPPSGFADRSCAAWSTGGGISGVTAPSTFAGIGLQLVPTGATYDLSAYSGVTVLMESGQEVYFVVEDDAGGYFGSEMSGGGSGSLSYSIYFADLAPLANSQTATPDLSHATQLEFDSDAPTSYGFAIHAVSLF